MGKYAKFALVCLYALQVIIVFKDELTQLYHGALTLRRGVFTRAVENAIITHGTRHNTDTYHDNHAIPSKNIITDVTLPHLISVAVFSIISHEEHPHEFHPDEDDKKNREKRLSNPRYYPFVLGNLFLFIKKARNTAPNIMWPIFAHKKSQTIKNEHLT